MTAGARHPIAVLRLPHAGGLPLPAYASDGAAGMDLAAAVREPLVIAPGGRAAVPTGIAVALPPAHELQIRPRSGLAIAHGVTVLNTPGTIDEDYRGELLVILVNLGASPFVVERGARIAQAVLAPVRHAALEEVASLPPSRRGGAGFGSTGA